MDFSPDLRNITSNVTKQILSKMNLTSFDLNSTQFQEFLADENAVLMLSIALHIVGVCADLVLIYLGFFKRKYRTSSNVLLANWALANLIHSIIMPIVGRLLLILKNKEPTNLLFCTLSQIGNVCKCSQIMFLLLLTGNWYVSAYYSELHGRLKKFLKIIAICLWIATVVIIFITIASCLLETHKIPLYIFDILYLALGVILIKLHSNVALQRYRAETEFGHPTLILNLVSLFIFIWGLDVVETFADNIKILPLITDWLNTISPVFVVAVLFGFENEFKEYGGKLVKRLRGRHQNKKPDIELVNVAKEVSVLHTSKVEEV